MKMYMVSWILGMSLCCGVVDAAVTATFTDGTSDPLTDVTSVFFPMSSLDVVEGASDGGGDL